MNWGTTYILSQVFTIIMYILLGVTYFLKDRKKILIVGFASLIANALEYVFLFAWTGVAMCAYAFIRNTMFLIDENKNGKRESINKKDILVLIILYLMIVIFTAFTYDGLLSLLSVVATAFYTYSVWQKKTLIYKLCGIPVGILWIMYNIYVMSLFGIILESILLRASTSGYLMELKKQKEMGKIEV